MSGLSTMCSPQLVLKIHILSCGLRRTMRGYFKQDRQIWQYRLGFFSFSYNMDINETI